MPDGSLIQDRDPLMVPSTRRNPVLADVFNRLGYMERKGSRFGKIISGYEFQINYNEKKKPSFRSDRYQFTVVMPNLNYGVTNQETQLISDKDGANVAKDDANGIKSVAKTEDAKNQIYEIMKDNSKVTQKELADRLGVSKRTVQRMTESLVREDKVIRVGSKRSGHWEVTN